jgi:selT/selW/selH-like putative selenoprotein
VSLSQKCDTHKWCTMHEEKKYKDVYEKLKAQIENECPEVTVIENQEHPSIMSIITQPTARTPFAKLSFPKTGSCEVYFRGQVVFSKLKLGIWPHPAMVAKSIRDILDAKEEAKMPKSTGFKEFQSKPEGQSHGVADAKRTAGQAGGGRGEKKRGKSRNRETSTGRRGPESAGSEKYREKRRTESGGGKTQATWRRSGWGK